MQSAFKSAKRIARLNRTESSERSVAICVAVNCGPAGMKPAETPFWVTRYVSLDCACLRFHKPGASALRLTIVWIARPFLVAQALEPDDLLKVVGLCRCATAMRPRFQESILPRDLETMSTTPMYNPDSTAALQASDSPRTDWAGYWFAPMTPRNFCLSVLGIVTSALLAVGLFNWVVNPYGQYATSFVTPVVHDTRSLKVELLDEYQEPPQGLILGSSRAMKFEPEYLKSKTSLSFFNFGVNHGRPEDYLAIVRMWQHRFGKLPKVVMIAVDVASLNDVVPNDGRLSAEPELLAFARDTVSWTEEFDRFCQLFSYQQSVASIRSIRSALQSKKESEQDYRFDADGVIHYLRRKEDMTAGLSPEFEKGLDFNEREFLSTFSKMSGLSAKRLGYLRETLRICADNDCQVVLFTTVHHPRLREFLQGKTKFEALEKQATEALSEMASEFDVRFVDFGKLESFQGSPAAFVDGIHPLESNTRLMIDLIVPASMGARYAIQ
jgi:hypothetical protein